MRECPTIRRSDQDHLRASPHRRQGLPRTIGPVPGARPRDRPPTTAGKIIYRRKFYEEPGPRSEQFLAWSADGEPTCVTTNCVDTSAQDVWAYLEVATTFESYCQRYFGADHHPLLRPYEYYDSSGDQGDPVPQDAQVFDLNAGAIGTATKIYGCAAYTGATANTMSPTQPPAHGGDLINLKALVDPTDGQGTVGFTSDGATLPGCGAVDFSSGGATTWQATCATRGLFQGTHTITAVYSGDATYSSVQATGQEVISRPT